MKLIEGAGLSAPCNHTNLGRRAMGDTMTFARAAVLGISVAVAVVALMRDRRTGDAFAEYTLAGIIGIVASASWSLLPMLSRL